MVFHLHLRPGLGELLRPLRAAAQPRQAARRQSSIFNFFGANGAVAYGQLAAYSLVCRCRSWRSTCSLARSRRRLGALTGAVRAEPGPGRPHPPGRNPPHATAACSSKRVDRFVRERLLPRRPRATAPLDLLAWQVPGEPVPLHAEAASAGTLRSRPEPPGPTLVDALAQSIGLPCPPVARRRALPGACDPSWSWTSASTAWPVRLPSALVWRPDGVIVKRSRPTTAPQRSGRRGRRIGINVEAAANPDVGSDWSFRPTAVGRPRDGGRRSAVRSAPRRRRAARRDRLGAAAGRARAARPRGRAVGRLAPPLPRCSPRSSG